MAGWLHPFSDVNPKLQTVINIKKSTIHWKLHFPAFDVSSILGLSSTNLHLPLALAIYLYEDWNMCCCSCWFSTLPEEFRVERRNEALRAQEKNWLADLQVAIYFQELILLAQFLYLLMSRKALDSFMVMIAPVSSINHLPKNMCLIACIPPSPKSPIYWPLPLPI